MKQGELDCWSSVPAIMLWCILFFVVPVALARPSDPIVQGNFNMTQLNKIRDALKMQLKNITPPKMQSESISTTTTNPQSTEITEICNKASNPEEEIECLIDKNKDVLEQLKLVENTNDVLNRQVAVLEELIKKYEMGATLAEPQRPECPTIIGSNSMCQAVNEPKGCYCLIDQWSSWDEAVNLCRERGANLVSMETPEENDALKKLYRTPENIQRNDGRGLILWTSGRLINDEWVWTSTNQLVNFTDWREGEPNRLGNLAEYIQLWISSEESGWNDEAVWKKPGYEAIPLCEI